MRRSERLAWLGIADGAVASAVAWRWAFGDGPRDLIDAATAFALLIGFLGAVHVALRTLAGPRAPGSLFDVERQEALLLFPAEGANAVEAPKAVTQPLPAWPSWITVTAYGILMIALMWRWAVVGEPYNVVGVVMLSVLMLGFLRDATITLERLGRSTQSGRKNEEPNPLLLFPAEDAGASDLVLAPRLLATRRKALL